MPFPLIPLALGALVGAGFTYICGEDDKKKVRDTLSNLERSHLENEKRLKQAADREVRHRFEKMSLLLAYYESRLREVTARESVDVFRLVRLSATANQLTVVRSRLRSDGTPDPRDVRFLENVNKAMDASKGGAPLTRSEIQELDAYLEREQPGAQESFLKQRIAATLEQKLRKRMLLAEQERKAGVELTGLLVHEKVHGPSQVTTAAIAEAEARIAEFPARSEALQVEIDDLRSLLVILTRLGRPESHQRSAHDIAAEELVRRRIDGSGLTAAERHFLAVYRDAYFGESRELLRREGVKLLLSEVDFASAGA